MAEFKRDMKFMHHGEVAVIQGPEDFDGYEYNRPGPNWELILYPDGQQAWCGDKWLEPVDG